MAEPANSLGVLRPAAATAAPEDWRALPPAEALHHLTGLLVEQAARFARVLPARVSPGAPLALLGLDSLAAIEWQQALSDELGVSLPLAQLTGDDSVGALALSILGRSGAEPVAAAPLASAGDALGEHPASYGQRALWFLDRLAPGDGAYNIAAAGRVSGRLDVAAFGAALDALVARHPALRTTFLERGEPLQQVWPWLAPERGEIDAHGWEEARLRRRLADEANRPFDLARGPLLRVLLFQAEGSTALLFAVHHIVCDLWSLEVMARELSALYDERTGGAPARLAPLAWRYSDFTRWQQQVLAGPFGERLWQYWRRQLEPLPPPLELPTDRPRTPGATRGGRRSLFLEPRRAAAIERLARLAGATLPVALATAYALELARAAGRQEIALGFLTGGRGRPELGNLVGYFVNPLVLRLRLNPRLGLRDLVGRVRQVLLGAFDHQDYPLPLLADRLRRQGRPERDALFQALFTMQTVRTPAAAGLVGFTLGREGARLRLGRHEVESMPLVPGGAQFDLTLAAGEIDGGVAAALLFDANLFHPATLDRLLRHWGNALDEGAADPERPLCALSLLTPGERHQLLVEGNDSAAPGAPWRSAAEMLAAPAARHPDAIAACCGEQSLTYGELERSARRLAARLQELGVGPEARVGVCLERSAALVVAFRGILAAGGAYVPMDPAYPAARLGFMAADAGIQVLVGERATAGRLPSWAGATVWLDEPPSPAAVAPAGARGRGPALLLADNLAYVIYTSGSTGKPKGVGVSHRALINLVEAVRRRPGLHRRDVVLAATSLSFDVAVGELAVPLAVGARLVVARGDEATDGTRLAALAARSAATVLPATPTTYGMLIDGGWEPGAGCFSPWSAGEALPPSLGEKLGARSAAVWNLYGPTEAAIYALVARVRPGAPVRIGLPLGNLEIAVLGSDLEPLPLGVPGELYLAGAGIARGYWGRPELTAERFVPRAFGSEPGGRAYRTGDLARWCTDGDVEYLGRIDQQVKVRGHRIEAGEVEEALLRLPGVHQAVVGMRPDAQGQGELVAWLVPAAGASLSGRELGAALRRVLPAAFVPSRWLSLPQLPRSPSGKVDRRALPAPAAPASAAAEAPRGAVEQMLAEIWGEALGIPAIGRGDDLFALGAHSLIATGITARVREVFGVDLGVRALLETPRLLDQADRIAALRRPGDEPPPRVERHDWGGGDAPLSCAQEPIWLFEQLVPGTPVYHLAAALWLAGSLRVAVMRAALAHLTGRHEILRTRLGEESGRPTQVVEPAVAGLPLPVLDLAALPAALRRAECRRRLLEAARWPFDLRRAGWLRALLVRGAAGEAAEQVLLVVLHHAAGDAWSIELLARELGAAYSALARREAPALPALAVQYRDWALWQRQWLGGEAEVRESAFWRERLEPPPPPLDLPADRPRAAVLSYRGGRLRRQLPRRAAAALAALARRRQVTAFMAVLAAFQALLGRLTGQLDFAVGVPFSGRARPEAQPLIGCFVNTLAIRAELAAAPRFLDLLARVRQAVLAAHDHAEVPLEALLSALRPERDASRHPLFQTLFNMVDRAPAPALPGLRVEIEELWPGCIKLDLALSAERQGHAGEGMALALAFASDLLDATTAARWLSHLEVLLLGALEDPERPLVALPLLSAGERWQLLGEWAHGEGSRDADAAETCIHQLFQARVERFPDAVAAVCESAWITSGELDRRARDLAARLRDLGVGPESRVGLAVEPSLAMLIAVLAVLAAGGAYVPLSAQFPAERQLFILEDAGAHLLIAERARRRALAGFGGRVLLVDDGTAPPSGRVPGSAGIRPLPGNAAYVIYTSGSTGRPKGVVVEHRQIVAYVRGIEARVGYGGAAALVQPMAVDSSKTLLFGALAHGCCLHLVAAERATDAGALADYFDRHGIEQLKISPSHLAALHGAAVEPRRLLPRRWLMLGGEASRRQWVDELQRLAPGCEIWNHYGPTETTVGVLAYRVTGSRRRPSSPRVPMGHPLPGCSAYLLDREGEPVAIGVPGQLFIGGRYLARGYLARPEATAEAFLPDPFCGAPGVRLYRTGDLARRLPDGALEFLGRVDKQLKVRGFRVEPGEIEAALGRHAAVREVVVADWTDRAGNRRLAAYWTVQPGSSAGATELRRHLKDHIPEFMIPAAFVRLAHLPRLPHGKVDLGALPEPVLESRERDSLPPAGAVEEQLAAIWCEVLGLDRVGAGDDFFALGGDSILSIQIVSRASRLGLRLTPRQLFQHPTIAELAQVAGTAAPGAGGGEPAALAGPVALGPVQAAFFAQDLAEPWHFNQAVLLELAQAITAPRLGRAVAALVAHHDALRHRFARGPWGWSQRATAAERARLFGRVDLAAVPRRAAAAALAAAEQVQAGLDLERGPLLRAVLFHHGGDRRDRLLLVIHHLVVDAVSWRILLDDLALACAQLALGGEPALPARTASYQRWAAALAQQAGSEAVAAELAFWLAEERAAPPRLPGDQRPGEELVASAQTLTAWLSEAATARLLRGWPRMRPWRVDAVLLAALAASLRDWTGCEQVLVDLEGHGREGVVDHLDVTRTVGWFTAVFPVRLDLAGARRPAEVVERASRRLGELSAHGLAYGIARFLGGEPAIAERLGRIRPEVKLNYLGQLEARGGLASGWFRPLQEPAGAPRSPRGRRGHRLELAAAVVEGRLRLDWTCSRALHAAGTVGELAASCCRFVERLLEDTAAPAAAGTATREAHGLTPAELQAVLGEFEFEADG